MIEDLMKTSEPTRSILIVDSFEKDAKALLFSFISNILFEEKKFLRLYPTIVRSRNQFKEQFDTNRSDFKISNIIIDHLFLIDNEKQCFLNSILEELDQEREKSEFGPKKKSYLVFDNINLILRHFQDNPFKLMRFLSECRKREDVSTVLMVVHQDSLDETILNQIKSCFQTIIDPQQTLKKNDVIISNVNRNLLKYEIKIKHKNFKSASKISTYEETVYLNDSLTIEKVDKQLKPILLNSKTTEKDTADGLKGLTFNVHLNSSDIEAKKNLILPYEIIGLNKSNQKTPVQIKLEEDKKQEESKIYYEPDERDDVDDDDPDDDLNF